MKHSSICTRSIVAAVALSLAAIAAPNASAQTTATTVPVGFLTATIPAAPSLTTPASAVVSIPLYQTAVFQSTVATVGPATTKFTISGAAFGNLTTVPHLVRVKTSVTPSHVGRFFLITANTATELTVALPFGMGNVSAAVSLGDSCEVVPANTFGNVFQAVLPQIKKSGDPDEADNFLLWNGVTWNTYYYDSDQGFWASASVFGSQNNTVILPDEGLFIVHKLTAAIPLVLMGTVPSTAEQSDLPGGTPAAPGQNFVSNRFPVNTTFGTMALQNLPGWVRSGDPDEADNALLWNGTTWNTYYYDSDQGFWASASVFGSQNNTPIPTAGALFVIRKGGVQQASVQALPYAL